MAPPSLLVGYQLKFCRFSMLFTHLASKNDPFDESALYHPPDLDMKTSGKPLTLKIVFSEDNEKEHPKHAKLYVCRTIPQLRQYTFKTLYDVTDRILIL
jgi:hypothetical protein